jgi:hypothetical protein
MCDRHPPFSIVEHGDRATRSFPEAIALAQRKATRKGQRQIVTTHTGPLLQGVFFIQDAERVEAWRRDHQEATA